MLLAMLAAPAMAEQCDASHIVLTKTFPATDFVNENSTAGVIFRFALEGCDNLGSVGTPREYRIAFCAEFFDTTRCNDGETNCLSNGVAGARGLSGTTWTSAGAFKRCAYVSETESFISALMLPYNNNFRDDGQNSLYAMMNKGRFQYIRLSIIDDE